MVYTLRIASRLSAVVLLAASAFTQRDPNAAGSAWPAGTPRPLPDFDIRLSEAGLPAADLGERNAAARTEASDADERGLRARIPLLRIDRDALFGTPRWIASTARFLTEPVAGDLFDAVAVTRAFVAAHGSLLEIAPEELDRSRRARDYATQHNGIRHLTFQQQIGGIDLLGAELRANVTRHGELMNVSSTMLARPEGDFAPSPVVLTRLRAIQEAARSIGVEVGADPASSFRTDLPVTTELAYFPLARDEIRAAWKVFLPEIGVGNDYEIVVDATDGRILSRRNFLQFAVGGTQPIALSVYTSDSPAPGSPGNATPDGFQFPMASRSLVTILPGQVPYSPNSWIDDGDNDTQGNNVDAHTDLNSDNLPDLPRPTGSPFRVFDFRLDHALEPYHWRDAAVTNLFYVCNVFHDRTYALGFDEAAGNFQTVNFTGLGLGNDRLQADCQDGSGTNNANFATLADGISGRMQMYLFPGPSPSRDGSLDSDIIFHEFTHGLSMRLHALQLIGTQSSGMGEGWSDYVALSMNAEQLDDPYATYTLGGYTTYQIGPGFVDNYYYGIRRFPCSTDLGKNPMTYGDIDPAQQSYPPGVPRSPVVANTANEIHNVGNLWCTILFEARANLWTTFGFAANDRLLQLVVDAMKLDPGTPDFLQARDAILQADLADFGGADFPDLWAAFAKRGCGYSARSPGGVTSNGIVEAFDLPILFEYPAGIPTQLPPNQSATFPLVVSGTGSMQTIPGTGTLFLSLNGGPFTPTALVETTPDHYDVTIPGGACFDEMRFYLRVATNWGFAVNPGGAPDLVYTTRVRLGEANRFDDDFQTNKGWVVTSGGAISGAWARGVPVNDPNWAYDPIADADGSGSCYVTGNAMGNSDVDGGAMILTSPDIDMTGGADITYSYYLYLTDESGADRLDTLINENGGVGPFRTIASHQTSGSTSWRTETITAGELASLGVTFTPTMRLRFVVNDADPPSVVEAGVDAVHVRKPECSDPVGTSFCFGDASGSGCPCSNTGVTGHGCENSIGTGGARLDAAGTTNPDRVILLATGELNSALTLFVQGDAVVSDAHFGDGLRCVGGSLKRLYAKNASQGQVSAPGLSDLSITAQSAALGDPIAAGDTRYYFTYYRDPSGSFCPAPAGGTFNATNAFTIVW
ncbi:MAG TPA: M36 family metallopeptidase [Planctomycetota bacterium]|jgi:hypothetical protein|nr:M36 family metallopeptidase [Planctomycetota bacterium]